MSGVFEPELFAHRARAMEMLERGGFRWMTDFASVDLLHSEFGLEVCGIKTAVEAARIRSFMQRMFPQWKFSYTYECSDRQAEDYTVTVQRNPSNHTDTY
jgi:hypothetical protein